MNKHCNNAALQLGIDMYKRMYAYEELAYQLVRHCYLIEAMQVIKKYPCPTFDITSLMK